MEQEESDRFDRAVNFLIQDRGVRFSPKQSEFLDLVKKGVHATWIGGGATTIQTAAAACFAVSQIKGDVIYLGQTGRRCREWIALYEKWLAMFQDHPEFGFIVVKKDAREFVMIKNKKSGVEVRVSAFDASAPATNLRGLGTSLALIISETKLKPEHVPLLTHCAFLIMCTRE